MRPVFLLKLLHLPNDRPVKFFFRPLFSHIIHHIFVFQKYHALYTCATTGLNPSIPTTITGAPAGISVPFSDPCALTFI